MAGAAFFEPECIGAREMEQYAAQRPRRPLRAPLRPDPPERRRRASVACWLALARASPDVTDLDGAARLCGLRACRQPVVPAAFIEGTAWIAGHLQDVRVEVCAPHFEAATGERLPDDPPGPTGRSAPDPAPLPSEALLDRSMPGSGHG